MAAFNERIKLTYLQTPLERRSDSLSGTFEPTKRDQKDNYAAINSVDR